MRRDSKQRLVQVWIASLFFGFRREPFAEIVIAPLHAVTTDDGVVYTTNRPVPVSGSWKALIRLHKGRELGVVPVFLPADPAIPAPAFAPTQHYRGAFVANKRSCNGRQSAATIRFTTPLRALP